MCFALFVCWKMRFDCFLSIKPGLHNIRPAGSMSPARAFSIERCCKSPTSDTGNCGFRISSKLQRTRLLRPAANSCWSNWPFELSELCRPVLNSQAVLHLPYALLIVAGSMHFPLVQAWHNDKSAGRDSGPDACSKDCQLLLAWVSVFRI